MHRGSRATRRSRRATLRARGTWQLSSRSSRRPRLSTEREKPSCWSPTCSSLSPSRTPSRTSSVWSEGTPGKSSQGACLRTRTSGDVNMLQHVGLVAMSCVEFVCYCICLLLMRSLAYFSVCMFIYCICLFVN